MRYGDAALVIAPPRTGLRLGLTALGCGLGLFLQSARPEKHAPVAPKLMEASLTTATPPAPRPAPIKALRSLKRRVIKALRLGGPRMLAVKAPAPEANAVPLAFTEEGQGTSAGAGVADGVANGALPTPPPAPAPPPAGTKPRPFAKSWNCDWPDTELNEATVHIRVFVDARGRAKDTQVEKATDPVFIAQAKECALMKSYVPGKDASGRAVADWTDVLPVHFQRYGNDKH